MKSFAKGLEMGPAYVRFFRSVTFEKNESPLFRNLPLWKYFVKSYLLKFDNYYCNFMTNLSANNAGACIDVRINPKYAGMKIFTRYDGESASDCYRDTVKVSALYFARQQNRARFITESDPARPSPSPGATEVDTYVIGQPARVIGTIRALSRNSFR